MTVNTAKDLMAQKGQRKRLRPFIVAIHGILDLIESLFNNSRL